MPADPFQRRHRRRYSIEQDYHEKQSSLGRGAARLDYRAMHPAAAHAQTAESETKPSWSNDIVVTGKREGYAAPDSGAGTRTDTPLIQVPQSVQVLTRTLIQKQDRRTLGDALVNVSGVVPTRSKEQLLIPPLVRGFPPRFIWT